MDMVRVVNQRPTFLTTPALGKPGSKVHFPAKRLTPGGNNLPVDHVKALDALPRDRGPGRVWAQWKDNGLVKVLSPKESATEVRKKEGPEAPQDLAERTPAAAEAMVMVEDSPEVLRRWFARDRREPIRAIIQDRLAQLGAGLEA